MSAISPPRLSPVVLDTLRAVRRRWLIIGMLEAVLFAAIALLGGMLMAMGVDWLVTILERGWRLFLTSAVLLVTSAVLVRVLVTAWAGGWRLTATAQAVDRRFPSFQERWSTVTELTGSADPPEIRGSDRLLRQTMLEAESRAHLVSPHAVVSSRRLHRARYVLLGLTALLLALLLVAPEPTRVLMRRFWNPLTDISLTQLKCVTGTRLVPRGEPLTLAARAEGRVCPDAELDIRGDSEAQQLRIAAASHAPGLFSHFLPEAREVITYRFRSGDAQTDWFRITPADRPTIEAVRLRITPPEYSRLRVEEHDRFPRYRRVLEGSRLDIAVKPTGHVAAVQFRQPGNVVEPLTASTEPGWYRYEKELTENLTITPQLVDENGLTNAAIPDCRIVVYRDAPPMVEITAPEDDLAIGPDEPLEIQFRASDDLGVARAELLARVEPERGAESDRPTQPAGAQESDHAARSIAIPLKEQANGKFVKGHIKLDPRELGLKAGTRLTYAVRVSDLRAASSTSNKASAREGPPGPPPSSAPALTRTEQTEPRKPDADKRPNGGSCSGSSSPQAAKDRPPAEERPRSATPPSSRPGSEMTTRLLDAASGSTCSRQQRIHVNEWSAASSPSAREKKQIAIENYLKRLDAALASAQAITVEAITALHGQQPWTATRTRGVVEGRRYLEEGDAAITQLKSESTGTPYAMIGLQLDDIGVSHVSPARQKLLDVEMGEPNRLAAIEQADLHIARARQLLADLTKRYEAVKRELDREEATRELARMHQLFAEDMQILLGACRPTLNPRSGKWQIVPDDIAEAILKNIQENLQRKKELMDALARILAGDPDLLRRYMAMTRKEGRSLRDQATLLAGRQRDQKDRLTRWTGADQAGRVRLCKMHGKVLLEEQGELASLAALLRDNTETWAPREEQRGEAVLACRAKADELAQLARQPVPLLAAGQAGAARDLIEDRLLPALHGLQDLLVAADAGAKGSLPLLRYIARRLDETAALLSRQEDWLLKSRAVGAGQYEPVATLDQRRLSDDTAALGEKVARIGLCLRGSTTQQIGDTAEQVAALLSDEIPQYQHRAMDSLKKGNAARACVSHTEAVGGFTEAEKKFDELLALVEDFASKQPVSAPQSQPAEITLEERLARLIASLQEEADACQKLGAVVRSNIQVNNDWAGPGADGAGGSGRGQDGSGQSTADTSAGSESGRPDGASQRSEYLSAAAAAKLSEHEASRSLASAMARKRSEEGPPGQQRAGSTGVSAQGRDWDVLVSKLGDAMRQAHDTTPPEQYRAAIDAYFRNIAGQISAGKSATTGTAD